MAGLLLSVVLFGVASSVVASGQAWAAPAESGPSIIVEGNRRVEAETIRSYFKVGSGEQLDAAKINSGLKALYASGLFQDIRISQRGGRLVVTVVEAPVIDRLAKDQGILHLNAGCRVRDPAAKYLQEEHREDQKFTHVRHDRQAI